jgi:hypothetical protein
MIVTITAQVSYILDRAIAECSLDQATFEIGPPLNRPKLVCFAGVPYPTLVLRSLRHPSYPALNAERLRQVRACCEKFVARG